MTDSLILHCVAARAARGGIQGALQHHARGEAAEGFRTRFIGHFDPVGDGADHAGLGGHGWETIGALRRRFAVAAAATPAAVAIYHDGWGVDWFAPLDGATRRVVFLHTEPAHIDKLVARVAPQVDGFLTVSRALAERVCRAVPDFPAERVRALPYVVDAPVLAAETSAAPAGPVRFGYAGRVLRAQKRMERLPALIAELDRRGVDYVFEVLGDGEYLPELQRQLGVHPRVRFLPWREGEDYWRTLAGWRAVVLLSDYEGFSRAVMEGMMVGAVPVYPDFSPAAREILGPATAAGLYPVGDMTAVADRLAALATMPEAERAALRAAQRTHLAGHTPARYFAGYAEFLSGLLAAPARAKAVTPPWWHDRMLLGVYTRLFPHYF